MNYEDDYEPDWSEGPDMDDTKATGEGITVQINQGAMERIEAAAAAGLRQELSARLDKLIAGTISEIVDAKLVDVVGALAEKTIMEYLTKPRAKTNHYGEAISGTAMTIADQIPEKVEKWFSERVENSGNRATYQDAKYPTRLDFIVNKFVRDELNIATKAAADQVTEKAKQVVSAHVGRFVAEQMIPQIELNGAGR